MKRSVLNLVVDFTSLVVMLCVAVTGLLIRWVLPPGSRGGAGLSLWGWTRHDWGDLHFYLITVLGGMLLIHLALHWNWVCMLLRSLFARPERRTLAPRRLARNLYGVVTLVALAGGVSLFLWIASGAVSQEPRGSQERNRYGVRNESTMNQTDSRSARQETGRGQSRRLRGNR